jgi:mono/diheme cytochrome c family protein
MIAAAMVRGALCGDARELWSSKVQPLFDVNCVKCHGPLEQKSGLELDTADAVLKGGDEGKVINPGKPEESRLYQYLSPKSDPHMPPKKQLGDADIAFVREWILALGKASDSTTNGTARLYSSISEAVDGYVAEGWTRRGVKAAEPLEDRAWCRRVYLDLAGRIPNRSELESFLASESKTKREELVDRLIASDEYARHMRDLWDVFLMGRGRRENQLERRGKSGWWAFLEYSFRENRPWNETVREFLVARPAKDELKGAYWFLFERRDQHQAIAEAVSPVVYGTQINCAQCHDHPLAREIKQAHYWGLVAAFNRSKNVKDEGVAESAVGGNVNFTNLKKESQPAVVALLTGKTLSEPESAGDKKEDDADEKYVDPAAKVRVPKFSRREAFADATTHGNPLLARAFVNRMWAVLMGRGLVHPADQMNARNGPSHPELLEWLSQDFAKSGYDVKRLVRGLVLSRVYGLSHGDAPAESFASAIERPLTAEQLAASWRVASGLAKDDEKLQRAVVMAIPDVLPKDYNATFQQAQFLENSPALADLLKPREGNTAERIEKLATDQERVAEAFFAVMGRSPDAEEASTAEEFLKERGDKKADGVRDLLWALMTSAEFLTMP